MGIFWQAKPVLLHRCENVPAYAVGEGGRKIFICCCYFSGLSVYCSKLESPKLLMAETQSSLQ